MLFQSLNALSISKSEEFTLEHKPKFKKTSFEVIIEHSNQNIIEHKIQSISQIVRKADICKGGEYRIRPNYKWENNTKVYLGYSSNIIYNCEFIDKKAYENLLDKVKKVDNIKIMQNEIRFIQTKEEKIQKTQELENLAFEFAKKYVQKLNNSFKSCKIESIDLHSNHNTFITEQNFVKLERANAASKSKVSLPINKTFKNSIIANYKFSCL